MGGMGTWPEGGSGAELQSQSFRAVPAVPLQKGKQAWRAAPTAWDPWLLSRPPQPPSQGASWNHGNSDLLGRANSCTLCGILSQPEREVLCAHFTDEQTKTRRRDLVRAHRLQVLEPGSAHHRQVPLPPQAAFCPFYRWVSSAFLRSKDMSLVIDSLSWLWPLMQRNQGLPSARR